MIRKGRFARVNGIEYELFSFRRKYYLKSKDILDLANGFKVFCREQSEYIKSIILCELEDAYEVFPYAMLSGYRFSVEGANSKKGTIALVTSNPFVQKKVDVRPYRPGEFIIELPYEDVIIQEERIPILGFENNYPMLYK